MALLIIYKSSCLTIRTEYLDVATPAVRDGLHERILGKRHVAPLTKMLIGEKLMEAMAVKREPRFKRGIEKV